MSAPPAGERLPGRLLGLRTAGLFMAAGWVAIEIYLLLPTTAQEILYLVIGVSAVAAIAYGAERLESERLAWRLFALGLLCEVGGDAVSSYYELHLHREPPLPSLADISYLGGYPLLAVGIFLLLRKRGGSITRTGVLDTVIVFAAVATVQW